MTKRNILVFIFFSFRFTGVMVAIAGVIRPDMLAEFARNPLILTMLFFELTFVVDWYLDLPEMSPSWMPRWIEQKDNEANREDD